MKGKAIPVTGREGPEGFETHVIPRKEISKRNNFFLKYLKGNIEIQTHLPPRVVSLGST
jgi:hypothetical protein